MTTEHEGPGSDRRGGELKEQEAIGFRSKGNSFFIRRGEIKSWRHKNAGWGTGWDDCMTKGSFSDFVEDAVS